MSKILSPVKTLIPGKPDWLVTPVEVFLFVFVLFFSALNFITYKRPFGIISLDDHTIP